MTDAQVGIPATPGRRWQLAAGGLPLLLYVLTLAPTVTFEDSGSFLVAARHLGVAHPSGYPLWCLLAHVFTWLPLGSVAERVHFSSAVFAAAAAWLCYLAAFALSGRRLAALVAALALGTSRVLWSQAVVAEVYALNAAFAGLLWWLALTWRRDGERRRLLSWALAAGLALSNHPQIVLVIVPVAGWILWRGRRQISDPRLAGSCLLLFLGGLAVYLYLPLRARVDPPVNWHDPESWSAVLAHVGRAAYLAPAEAARYRGGAGDVLRHMLDAWRGTAAAVGWPLAPLALAGLAVALRRRPGFAVASLAVFLLHTLGFNAYVHAAFTDLWRFAHRVYYVPAHLTAALWLAIGVGACQDRLAAAAGRGGRIAAVLVRRPLLLALPLLLVVVYAAVANFDAAGRRGDRRARDFGLDVMEVLPREAGILPVGDAVVFTTLYLKYVEDVRPDVAILSSFFGWRGAPVSAVWSVVPLTDRLEEGFPWLEGFAAVPHGLGYLLAPPEQLAELGGDRFRPLPRPPRDEGLVTDERDPFLDGVRSTYAAYQARLGAALLDAGRADEADRALARAEELDPGDPWVSCLLAAAWARDPGRRHRVEEALARAAARYADQVDPAAERYYPVTADDIAAALASWRADGILPPGFAR